MRYLGFLLFFSLAACQGIPAPTWLPNTSLPPDAGMPPASTATPSGDLASTPLPSETVSIGQVNPTPQPQDDPSPLRRSMYQVYFHPDGGLYVGDWISIEVIPPEGAKLNGRQVRVAFGPPPGVRLGEAPFEAVGLGQRPQATLHWVWNTANLPAGQFELTFLIEPDGPVWVETVTLQPRGQLPPLEERVQWSVAESDCCLVHFLTNTAAHRDLPELLEMMDEQARRASQKMGLDLKERVQVLLLPRVVGQGGFANQTIVLSYLDRNYAGGMTATVFHHELIHLLDARLGGVVRPPLLVEGLAVYQSGGHYKPEPLIPRAAALLKPEADCTPVVLDRLPELRSPGNAEACGLDVYIPLAVLADQFYLQQHEIGYLEAGALVEYMVSTWGWDAFSAFYRDIQPQAIHSSGGDEQPHLELWAIDSALQRHFGINLEQLETQFLRALEQQVLQPEQVADVSLGIQYYENMRRYQQLFHPTAHFLNFYLPDVAAMRQRRIVADALRRPANPENLALETMLVSANVHLLAGEYTQANRMLQAVRAVLEGYEDLGVKAFQLHPVAADYYSLVNQVLAISFHPEKIQINGAVAQVQVSDLGPQIIQQSYRRAQGGWVLMTSAGMKADWFGLLSLWLMPTGMSPTHGQLYSQPKRESNGALQYRSR